MYNNHIYENNKNLTKMHMILMFAFIVIFCFSNYNNVTNIVYAMTFIGILLVIEAFSYAMNYFNRFHYLFLLRYSELFATSIYYSFVRSNYLIAITLIAYIIFYIELLTLYDYSESYYRVKCIFLATAPPVISLLIFAFFRSYIYDSFLMKEIILIFISYGIIFISNIFFIEYKELQDKLFAQTRLINDVNEVNEELRIQQEKVKHFNAELSSQKAKLQAAYTEINRSNSEIMIANKIMKHISSSLKIGKLMSLITNSLYDEMGFDICAISLDANLVENLEISYNIKTRFQKKYEEELARKFKEGYFQPYLTNDLYIDNRVNANQYNFINEHIGSILIIPLIQRETKIGFIFVGHSKYDAFLNNIEFFQGIVAQLLIALNNANLYARMENMAIHDTLTGIYNRGHLMKLFKESIEDTLINNTSLSVALFDIDNFKKFNDTYGHIFGDEVIKALACTAQEVSKNNNGIVGRYGGEEFVVIFPKKNLTETKTIIEQLHEDIKKLELVHKGEILHINVSIGISVYPENCKNPQDLINHADCAMYYSKQNGRGRITVACNNVIDQVKLKV